MMAETTRFHVHPSLVLIAVVLWMVMSVGTGTRSVDILGPGSSALCAASPKNDSLLEDDQRQNVTQSVHHVIRSCGWRSVVIFAEIKSGSSADTPDADDMARLLADHNLAVTVFQWPLTWTTDHSRTSSRAHDLYGILTSALSPHLLLVGSAEFVKELLKEVLRVKESATLTFNWLTTVPRDHKSSIATLVERFDNMAVVFQEQIPEITLETVVRNGDTTRLTKVKRWSPCSNSLPSLTEDLVFPNKKYGLGGRTLRILTLSTKPFMKRYRNGSTTRYKGLCMDLLHILTTKLNFTYVISEPPDRNWGQRLPNGTWIGIIGMLQRKEADFALSKMSLTTQRASVVDYSRGFFFDEVVLVTSFPRPIPVGWTFFTRPFHWLVFVLMRSGFIVLSVVLVLMDRCNKHMRCKQLTTEKDVMTKMPLISTSLAESAEALFGMLLGRAVIYTGESTSGCVLLVAWLLLSLVTVATYTGKLTSNSLVVNQPLPFRSLGELLKRSDYTWGFNKGNMKESLIGNSTDKDYQRFYRKMLEFEKTDPDVRTNSGNRAIRKMLTENYVRLTSDTFYRFNKHQYCQITEVREILAEDTLTVYFQKGSPYKQMFDEVIMQATEAGILEYLAKKWFPEPSSCQEEETRVMSVSLEQVPVAFQLAAGGLVLASGMLLLEFLTRSNTCLPQEEDPENNTQSACLPATLFHVTPSEFDQRCVVL